ncbi:Protein of unknown function [Streptococcus thermophilus]|nr:Protein of unknown function [Streptococcus thermophilus]
MRIDTIATDIKVTTI